jgi:uncharacterized membrane protein
MTSIFSLHLGFGYLYLVHHLMFFPLKLHFLEADDNTVFVYKEALSSPMLTTFVLQISCQEINLLVSETPTIEKCL